MPGLAESHRQHYSAAFESCEYPESDKRSRILRFVLLFPSFLMPPKALKLYTSDIPRGYVKGTAPDGSGLVIPQYFIPDLHQSFAALREKVAINVANAKPLVSFIQPATRSMPYFD